MREERSVITPDGTFEITGLPEGPGEIIGLCEGFIASHRGPNAKAYEQNQRYDLRTASDATPFILEMEPTGSVRVHIFDNTGQPLPDIVVNTWPNVFWAVGVSSIYVSASLWSATTDKQGVATIRGLRAGTEGVAVTGKNWQAPARVGSSGAVVRTMDATITPGQITDLMVTMEPAENTGEAQ